jgi:hypothetical protein
MANDNENRNEPEDKGQMSVSEAGHKGGERVRELIDEGRNEESGSSNRRSDSDEQE